MSKTVVENYSADYTIADVIELVIEIACQCAYICAMHEMVTKLCQDLQETYKPVPHEKSLTVL